MLGFRREDFARAAGRPLRDDEDMSDALSLSDIDARYVESCLMVEGDGVELVPSLIAQAGMGVRVTRAVPRGTLITKYEGIVVKTRALDLLKRSHLEKSNVMSSHTLVMNIVLSVVANFRAGPPMPNGDFLARTGLYPVNVHSSDLAGKGLGGFLNSLYDGDEALVPRGYNTRYVTVHDKAAGMGYKWMLMHENNGHLFMAIEATRDIEAGEELFVYYNRAESDDGPLNLDPAVSL